MWNDLIVAIKLITYNSYTISNHLKIEKNLSLVIKHMENSYLINFNKD